MALEIKLTSDDLKKISEINDPCLYEGFERAPRDIMQLVIHLRQLQVYLKERRIEPQYDLDVKEI